MRWPLHRGAKPPSAGEDLALERCGINLNHLTVHHVHELSDGREDAVTGHGDPAFGRRRNIEDRVTWLDGSVRDLEHAFGSSND
jgi:hypothetical protein